ncbi:hypothetical protein Tco_0914447 [Tanacetum coccineum]
MEKLKDENMSLSFQVESLIKERETVKLEYRKLFNSIKTTWTQHQKEVNELIENVDQKTYAYGDVRSKNQDLLMKINELKVRLKYVDKGKNMDTKKDLSKPVTSCSSPKIEQLNRIQEPQSSVSLVSNKGNTLDSNVLKPKANVLNAKVVNVVNDGSNIVCVSCGKDVFMVSHDKRVARYALPVNSKVKRSLFTSHITAKSSGLRSTLVVAKTRFSVATPLKAKNQNLEGEDLLTISRYSNLYTISISNMAASSPICLMSKATSTKPWRLKFKYDKDYLCPACEQGKSKRAILKPKLVASINSKLEMIHIVLCALMRVESINGKKYILEYYETRNPEVSTHSAATDTHNNEDTPSSSSIIVNDNEAPQIVSISEEPMNPVLDVIADESNQEDTTELDGNSFINPFCSPMLEEAESSLTNQDPYA